LRPDFFRGSEMQFKTQRMSVADYLAREERSQIKHEYVDGEIYAMSGASRWHQLLIGNLYHHARNTAGVRCPIFMSGMMLRVESRNSCYYPDVIASCDPQDQGDRYLTAPCFIIEVLSPSTASVDRREKRLAYLTLKSLDEYVLVDQDRMRIHVYRGGDRGPWASQVLDQPEEVLELTCIGLRVSLEDVYAGVDLKALELRDSDVEMPGYFVG
jgi:Uma2 family endonuclease